VRNDIEPLAAAADDDEVNSNGFIFIVPLLDY
jgi:hypothetical protein